MILRSLGPDAPFYRALTPSWAYQPESGAGAALVGGRFNRPQVEARYLAATPEAALIEYQGESTLLPPATLATYQVTAESIVDFTGGYETEHWSPIWGEAYSSQPETCDTASDVFRLPLRLTASAPWIT